MKITDCRIGEKIPLSELKVGGVFFWDEGGTLEGCKFYQRIRWDTGFFWVDGSFAGGIDQICSSSSIV